MDVQRDGAKLHRHTPERLAAGESGPDGRLGRVSRLSRRRPTRVVGFAILVLLVAAACGDAAASFDPTAPCTAQSGDGQAPGVYADLEATLPKSYEGTPPSKVDSGRACSAQALGPLASHGVGQMRFAGAVWDLGGGKGVSMAVFEADALTPAALADFYQQQAQSASRTNAVNATDVDVAGRHGRRLDVLFGESHQTLVFWPDADGRRVRALIAADIGDAKVAQALTTFGG